jgi:serine/threonine protein kinase/tetratricopeptide (TPR) repeat protein
MTQPENRTKSIFLTAVELPTAEEREAYLSEACGEDARLRREVEDLLEHHPVLGSFLEASAVGRPEPLLERPGTVIGPYRLLEQIGEGGFGVVFMAEQTRPVKRRVALKVIKPGMDTRQVIARFEAERQALALMDHPNIAKVLDAGATETGRPYFVMELVRGVPITEYCDQVQLTPRERLELFVTVCQALGHAHQKGIIHRDIKPNNVLVTLHDERPVVKVIDFGVAKATSGQLTDKTLFTGFAQVIGTPLYMSPEQTALSAVDIDTRSDIYSLGVLLYELLTGTTPFDRERLERSAFDEIRRIIREEEPQKPSTRLSTPGETLAGVAAVRRTEPRKLSQLVKGDLDWIVMKALEKDRSRRYETASGFAADVQRYLVDEPVLACPPSAGYRFRKFVRRKRRTLVPATLLGALLLVVAAGSGWMALDRAARRGRNAEAVAALLVQCEDALRAYRSEQAGVALDAAERRAADGVAEEQAGRLARCRADLTLLRAFEAIDAFSWSWSEGKFPEYAAVAARWPAPLAAYGITPDQRRVEETAGRVNSSVIRERVLTALDMWLMWELSAEARAGLRALLQVVDPDPYRDEFRDALAARKGDAAVALSARPEALAQPPRFSIIFGQFAKIPPDRKRAVLENALRTRPGDLALLMELGQAYQMEGRPETVGERVRWLQAAVSAHPENAMARNNLGVMLSVKGDGEGALACFREAIRLDPKFPDAHRNLGDCLAAQGDPHAALASYDEAIRQDPGDADNHLRRGRLLRAAGNLDGALDAYRKAIELNPAHLDAHLGLGAILCDDKQDFDGAIAVFEAAIRIDPRAAVAHLNLGNALLGKGDKAAAIASFRKAIEVQPSYLQAHVNLGAVLGSVGDQEGRITAYREAVRLGPKNAIARANLGVALGDRGDVDGGIAELRIALELDPKNSVTRRNLGNALQRKGDLDGVIKVHLGALEINRNDADAHNNLGWLLATGPDRVRDGKRAVEHATRACELSAWKEAGAIDTLAAAHAEAGDFAKAVERQKQALDFPAFVAADGEGGRQRLALYAERKAFRDPAYIPGEASPPPGEEKP